LAALYEAGRQPIREVVAAYGRRLRASAHLRHYDLAVVHREVLPFLPAWAERGLLSSVPYVLELDDAFFYQYAGHRRRAVRWLLGEKIARLARGARVTIGGSRPLVEWARAQGAHAVLVPTVVDLRRFPTAPSPKPPGFRVGWIGSPSTSEHLASVMNELLAFCRRREARLVVIGARPFGTADWPVDWLPWSEGSEVEHLCRFDVGIMPLPDTPWTRGKCGFKLIQCMAARAPVVASPVGANCDIVEHGKTGFLADRGTWGGWLERLFLDPDLRLRMGEAGYARVRAEFSLDACAPLLARALTDAAAGPQGLQA
jgi:glycosyltransferase involved in cell wall biosynthesis